MKACILDGGVGDYTNLKITDIEEPQQISANDIVIRHNAIGINFDDIMYRSGKYKIPKEIGEKPILGFEGVGEIIRKGDNVKSFKIGDMVGYACSPFGAYAEKRVIDYRYIFGVPNDIPYDILAGSMRKGLTAEYLLFKTANLRQNDTILIHSIAGGVGNILAKWAKSLGLKVIGTIGSSDKMSIAMSTMCDLLINRSKDDIFDKVGEFTDYKGVKVVYDGIGKPVFDVSKHCLSPFGLYVSYGYAGGIIDPIDLLSLQENSLFFTAPRIENYKSNRYELLCTISSVFKALQKGTITPNLTKYTFNDIPQAHADLETKKTIGSIVVKL